MDLFPVSIDREGALGPIDVALRNDGPGEWYENRAMYMVAIVDGIASVYKCENVDREFIYPDWDTLATIGPADDVAIEFDGKWVREPNGRYRFYSEGEPWIFWVDGGDLYAWQTPATPFVLASGNITKVSAVRGWKNVMRHNQDHGIVVAYIKDGVVHYRNFANQGTEANPLPAAWESEKEVVELPVPTQALAAFRTMDYRTGILCESEGEIHWAITDRNWAGMGVPPHTISARAVELDVDFIAIDYCDGHHEHTLSVQGTELFVSDLLWGLPYNSFLTAENDGHFTIYATCEHYLTEIDPADFRVEDENLTVFNVTNIETGENPCELIITVEDLSYSTPGDLTLKFLGSGATKGEAGQDHDPFEITFTPTGIEYQEIDPPEVEAIWNE